MDLLFALRLVSQPSSGVRSVMLRCDCVMHMVQVAQHEWREGLSSEGYCVGTGVGSGDGHELHLNASRDEIKDMINQIIRFDPYPCVLGIPVKPALFATSKIYISLCFFLVGTKVLMDLVSTLLTPQWSGTMPDR